MALTFRRLIRSPRIAPLGSPDVAGIAELDDVAIVLLGIEIVVLILIEPAALNDGVAAPGKVLDRLLAVGIEELDVMQAFAMPLEMLVIDAVAGERLHELK